MSDLPYAQAAEAVSNATAMVITAGPAWESIRACLTFEATRVSGMPIRCTSGLI